MRCERCTDETVADRCPNCGRDGLDERLAYRDRVQRTLIGWNRMGVVDAAALGRMTSQLAREKQALQELHLPAPVAPRLPVAPSPAAVPVIRRPEPVPEVIPVPWPTPRPARTEARTASLDGWLRQSAGWLVGAGLTVVGSVYLAGTLWDGLSAGWRTVITLLFLAGWSVGFGAVGRRLLARGFAAGGWLVGVGAAMAPVHAMAAGALWPHWGAAIALAAVGVVQGRALWRASADLAPGAGPRLWVPWLALSLLAGTVPLHLGLFLPTAVLAGAVWGLAVRSGGPLLSVAFLLGFSWLLQPLLGGARSPVELALPLALLSGLALYADLAWARWRGLWRIGLEGWRGLVVIGLGIAALACTVPSFAPLPSGPSVLATYGLISVLAVAAALAWRRPGLVGMACLGCLGFALTLPSLAEPLVAFLSQHASRGLGYGEAPLPLPWRALTFVPWLGGWLLAARWLPKTGWRQAPALQEQLRRWTFGVALVLLAFAPTLPGDPRPFLLAAPIYAAIGLLHPRIRVARPLELAFACVPVGVATLWWLLLGTWLGAPGWVSQLGLTAWLVGVVVAWPDRRIALVGWPLAGALFAVGAPEWALVGAGVVGLAALLVSEQRHRPVIAGVAPALLLGGAGLAGLDHGTAPWLLLAATVGLAGISSWLERSGTPTARTVLAWATAGVALTAVAGLGLDDPGRIVLRLALGAILLRWTWEHRDTRAGGLSLAPVYGAAFAAGIAETCWRRLGLLGVEPHQALAGGALAIGLWARGLSIVGRDRPWLADGVVAPARWVGAAVVAVGTALALGTGIPTLAAGVPLLALIAAAWLLAPRGTEWPAWVAVALGVGAKASAVPAGLALGLIAVPGAGIAAAIVAAAHGAFHGPAGAGWVGLAAGAGVLGWRARKVDVLRAPALVGALFVGALALEGVVHPVLVLYPLLAVTVGIGLVLAARAFPWRTEVAVTGHWLVLAAVPVIAVAVALPGHAGPLEVAAALLAAVYAASVKEPWVARTGAALALVAALQWSGAPVAGWVLAGTAALVAHHLVTTRGADRRVAWLELGVVALLVPALAVSLATSVPVALCWPLLAWVAGASIVALLPPDDRLEQGFLVPIGLAVGLVVASLPMGDGAWGVLLGAAALGVARAQPVRAVVLGIGLAVLLGTAAGLPGVAQVAVLCAAAVGYRWWRPETALDRWTTAGLTAWAAFGAGGALILTELGAQTRFGPPVIGSAVLAGLAAMAVPGRARWLLGPVGALLLAGVVGACTDIPHSLAIPVVLAGIAAAAAGWNRWSERAREDVDVLLALACVAPGVALLWTAVVDPVGRTDLAALQLGLATVAAALGGRREVAAALIAATLLCAAEAWIPSPIAAQLAVLLGVAWASARYAPWTSAVLRVAVPVVAVAAALVHGLGPVGWTVAALGVALELGWALRRPETLALWAPLASGGALLFTARLAGPLAGIPFDLVLPGAVGLAVLLEAAGMALQARRGSDSAEPIRQAAVGLLAVALVYCTALGAPTAIGLASVGALFCGRHVLRGGVPDLLVGTLLLDAGAVVLAFHHGLSDPLPYVAPFSLSALVVAQRLRGTLQAEAVTLIRYVAAGALYLTCFGQGLLDPVYTSVLVLLSVVGIVAGELIRVRSFLHLGVGFLVAAVGWNLMRFGLDHSRFWALYLTGLGVVVLGGMVVLTLNREAVVRMRQRLQAHVASWER